MKQVLFSLFLLFGSISMTFGQRSISGKVTDSAGEALIGANITAKGAAGLGTITDVEGMFSLSVPTNITTLVFSYTGYETQEIAISSSNVVNVSMAEGKLLEEIVVTALGVDRNARSVAYSNQTVNSEDLLSAPNKNTLEALRGKTAGVKISTGSGSVGASTRIVLRGESSLTGDNNALIVIDGVPIDNSASRGGNGSSSTGYADYGNRFNDINPEDIESVTILKGPAATSVYGSRGASGVVVVTTKKGKASKDKFTVGFNTTHSIDQAYVLLQRQDQFGQGFDGTTFDSGENFSWGPRVDGLVRPWTSPIDTDGDGTLEFLSRPYSAVPDQLDHFFRLGSTTSNNLSFSGSSDKFSYYASYGNANQQGILDNTEYIRNSFNFSASAKVSKKFKTDFGFNYSIIEQNSSQEGSRGFDGQNAYAAAIQTPITIPFQEIRDYKNKFHGFDGFYGSYTANPYYTLNEYVNNGKFNNLLGHMTATYTLLEGLDLQAKFGTNYVTRDLTTVTPTFQHGIQQVWSNNLSLTERDTRPSSPGELVQTNGQNTNINFTGQANYTRALSSSLKLNGSVGYDIFDRKTQISEGQTIGGFVVPGWYHLSNSVQQAKATQSSTNYRINGVFGNVNLGFDNWLFLDLSARNDWSSTLPSASNSFFYSAIGASAILSDLLKLQDSKYMDFLKLRGSYGTTGKDAGLYQLQSSFTGNPVLQALANGHDLLFPLNGQAGFTQGNFIGNPDLKPELTTTTELGFDAAFFNNILEVQYTFYNSDHKDQIITVNLPSTSGYTTTVKNIGHINNKGHELGLTIRPLGSKSKVQWEMNLNYSKNSNKVIKISDQQKELSVGAFALNIVATEGLPFGTFKGTVIDTDENGNQLIDGSGNPILTGDEVYLDSYQPDFLAGINNKISYKGFEVYGLLDIKQGGTFYSATKSFSEFNGTGISTLLNDRQPYVVPGVTADGNPNTKAISVYDYLLNLPESKHLIDASYIKLREVGLRYKLPQSICSKIKASNLTIGVFAKNLKFWLPAENTWSDPEVNGPALTGNAVGIETSQTPPAKSYGVSLSVNF